MIQGKLKAKPGFSLGNLVIPSRFASSLFCLNSLVLTVGGQETQRVNLV